MGNDLALKHWKYIALNEAAAVVFSNVDKKIYDNQKPVILCNYMDVFYNKRITSAINFMKSTASDNEIARCGLRKGDVVFTKDSETPEDIAMAAVIGEEVDNLVCGIILV